MTALYTKAELSKKSIADLRTLAAEHDLEFDTKTPTKAVAIEALLELEVAEEELEEELEDEVEEELEPEDELDDEVLPDEDEELELPDEEDEVEEAPKPTKAPAKKTSADKPAPNADSLAAKQVAHVLGTEAKTLRQFLRSDASTFEAVGSGGRYEFTKADVPKIKAEFDAWKAGHASRGNKRGAAAESTEPAEEIVEVEEIEELEEEEPLLDEEDDIELDEED